MDSPSIWQAVMARLKVAARPLFLSSTLFVGLFGLFIWQYITNPEWFGAYETGEAANEDIDLSNLTPEEQARLADIDNLSVLQNDFGDDENASRLAATANQDELSLLQALLGSTPGEATESGGGGAPLSKYLDNYRFLGGTQQSNASNTNIYSGLFSGSGLGTSGFGQNRSGEQVPGQASEGNGGQPAISALEAALQRNQAAAATTGEASEEAADDNGTETANGLPNPVTLPGVGTFLPTTPIMSPPPGTTGYTPPASLPATTPATGSAGASGLPAAAPAIPGSSSNFDLTPNVDIGGGTVLPNTSPIGSSLASPTSVANPAPYSVPRPPGSYIGGGYINTFSNPSGPPSN
jgi:hypothetical protein